MSKNLTFCTFSDKCPWPERVATNNTEHSYAKPELVVVKLLRHSKNKSFGQIGSRSKVLFKHK